MATFTDIETDILWHFSVSIALSRRRDITCRRRRPSSKRSGDFDTFTKRSIERAVERVARGQRQRPLSTMSSRLH